MALTAGTRIGSYEIAAQIGVGGMGEVYSATDTNLKRQVAIKVLPADVAGNAERLARFQREAEVLARLNHPHIAQIHGLERADGHIALVMELVEGPTLADRIAQGAVPVDEALAIARQIADALAAAHEQGIIHRDLKPANIKVRADGTVKVLDFGLAKALEPAGVMSGAPMSSMSPTITTPAMTQAGMILGTAAYMAPEQARGRAVDKRADIWAFGCVLYEMLTGAVPFAGEDVGETLAAVIKTPANLDAVPPRVRRLLATCLEKDPRQRLRDIGDWALLLDDDTPAATALAPEAMGMRRWLWPSLAALLVVVAGLGWLRPAPAGDSSTMALSILPPAGTSLDEVGSLVAAPKISPDGSAVLFEASGAWYVRRLDSLDAILVPGSERFGGQAFWAPDSTSVLYPATGEGLFRVRMPDGAPEVVMSLEQPSRGGSMQPGGAILMSVDGELHLAEAPGGPVQVLDLTALGDGMRVTYPEFLPDSDDVLLFASGTAGSDSDREGVYLATVENGAVRDPVRLMESDTAAHYTPAGGGHLLFVRDDNLYAQRLDVGERRLEEDSVLLLEGVGWGQGAGISEADFSVSRTGTVAWRPGVAAMSRVTTFDRSGVPLGTSGPPVWASAIGVSPDGKWLLAGDIRLDTLLIEIGRPGAQNTEELDPQLFGSLFGEAVASALGRGGRGGRGGGGGRGGRGGQLTPSGLSPDGRWVAYMEGGGLFVQPLDGTELRRQITPGGGFPRWRGDGQEILAYRDGGILSIPVDLSGQEPRFGTPEQLFSGVLRLPANTNLRTRPLAVSSDGSQIFWLQPIEQPGPEAIHVRTRVVN